MEELLEGKYLCCCLEDGEDRSDVYRLQERFERGKHGYRCTLCGREYPYLEIEFGGQRIDPNTLKKPVWPVVKYKKAADAFFGDHYYARNKKKLLKFALDADGNMAQVDEIPIMGDVYHCKVSTDERYVATETFGGTVAVIDLETKQTVAKRKNYKLNGAFHLLEDGRLLFYFENAIRCDDAVIWQVPEGWPGRAVCAHVLWNRRRGVCVFQVTAGNETWAVVVRGMAAEAVVRLPKIQVLGMLTHEPEQDLYTLPGAEGTVLLDGELRPVETIPYPSLVKRSDGGGMFPITRFGPNRPRRVILSPDGKWLLVDHFTVMILMGREDRSLRYCLFSYTGRTAQEMGFLPDGKFWYTWGDTTWVQG